jgi:hypothetical protein
MVIAIEIGNSKLLHIYKLYTENVSSLQEAWHISADITAYFAISRVHDEIEQWLLS